MENFLCKNSSSIPWRTTAVVMRAIHFSLNFVFETRLLSGHPKIRSDFESEPNSFRIFIEIEFQGFPNSDDLRFQISCCPVGKQAGCFQFGSNNQVS